MKEIVYQLLQHKLIRLIVFSHIVIASVTIVALVFTFSPFTSTAQTNSGGLSTNELTRITNEVRSEKGLVELTHSSVLATAAQARAQHMIDNNYFGHTYNGTGALDVKEIQKLGYGEPTGYIGENLYANSSNPSTIGTEYNQTIMEA
jgi:uncharacterized protein YkwD